MKLNNRLSSVLHALLHMKAARRSVTSETIAMYLNTNAVVVRRTMAGLRDAGFVSSVKGRGGGWSLTCDFETITMGDIYEALGGPSPFAIGNRTQAPQCLVEQTVNATLDRALEDANQLILDRFKSVTLQQLSDDFENRLQNHLNLRNDDNEVI